MTSQPSQGYAWRQTLEEKCLETIPVHCLITVASAEEAFQLFCVNRKWIIKSLSTWNTENEWHKLIIIQVYVSTTPHTIPPTPYPSTHAIPPTITTTPHSPHTQSMKVIREDVTRENVILLSFVLCFFPPHPEKIILNYTRSFKPMVLYRTKWSLRQNVWECPWLICNFKQCSPFMKRTKENKQKTSGRGKKVFVEEKVQGEIWKSKAPLSYLSIIALKALLHLEVSVV